LALADVISLHIDGRPENANFIDEREFGLMKDGVIFVNTSRGKNVNADVLAKYIKNGKIRGAGIDVFPDEPKSNDERFISVLQNLPNVILTPHIGGRSEEAQLDMGEFVPQKIINFINTGNTILSVNFPNLQLPKQGNAHRLIHIHKNVPGIMAKINGIMSEEHINIVGQYLGTDAEIGYVITDVNKKYDPKVLETLKKIPDTLRFRVLY
jgi:D-3-phosphoglycerate dehydrogenase